MTAAKQSVKSLFTVEEANQRLPLVRAIVSDIVALYSDVDERRDRLNRVRQAYGAGPDSSQTAYSEEMDEIEKELDQDVSRLEGYLGELTELGVELKDPVKGLIDFPTTMEGRPAYLCWKLGEEEIAFWHERDAGFQGRQSLFEGSLTGDSSEQLEDEDL